jgi:hypothetical protein
MVPAKKQAILSRTYTSCRALSSVERRIMGKEGGKKKEEAERLR